MKEISLETIEKISETKSNDSRQKILNCIEKHNIPEQSKIQLAIPTHRTRQWINFEQFRKLIEEGNSLNNLCKTYSKHLISFYSYLSQGKVSLTKDQFIEEYEKGIPLNDISKKYNIPREHITYLREYYGIKRKGATYQKRLLNEKPLSQDAKDIIIGSLLGDGHITKWGYFSEKHSPAQLDYLKWKASYFTELTTDTSWDYYEYKNKHGNIIKSHSFRTTAHSFLYEMKNTFYKIIDGKSIKTIPKNIEELMNEKVLAVWYMDDGCTDWTYREGVKEYINSMPIGKLCTECFTDEEVNILIDAIYKKFSIIGHYGDRRVLENKVGIRIKFDTINTEKLLKIVERYATPDLLYKANEKAYVDWMTKKIK